MKTKHSLPSVPLSGRQEIVPETRPGNNMSGVKYSFPIRYKILMDFHDAPLLTLVSAMLHVIAEMTVNIRQCCCAFYTALRYL